MYILRNAAHNILYTVANSNSINADVIGYDLEVWAIVFIVVDCIMAAGIVVWGVFAVRGAYKKYGTAQVNNAETEDPAESGVETETE